MEKEYIENNLRGAVKLASERKLKNKLEIEEEFAVLEAIKNTNSKRDLSHIKNSVSTYKGFVTAAVERLSEI